MSSLMPAVERSSVGGTPARSSHGRASWSGLLRFSLVAVPVKAYPAVSSSDTVSFNQLHAGCGRRISYQKHCPVHGQVEAEAIEKGYQYAPEQYVVIEPKELEQLRPAKEKALSLEHFLDAGQVDLVLFSGRTLYLFPDGLPAHRPYRVLAEAMQQRGKWALGRVTMSEQRQLVLIRPEGGLLSMHVLHYPERVRSCSGWQAELGGGAATNEELQLAGMLVDAASGQVDWSRYGDDTAQQLSALIEAKIEGRQVVAPPEEPVQILKLMDALKQSVAAACGQGAEAGSPPSQRSRRGRRRSA